MQSWQKNVSLTSWNSEKYLFETLGDITTPFLNQLNVGLGTDDVLQINLPVLPILEAAFILAGDKSISGLSASRKKYKKAVNI